MWKCALPEILTELSEIETSRRGIEIALLEIEIVSEYESQFQAVRSQFVAVWCGINFR